MKRIAMMTAIAVFALVGGGVSNAAGKAEKLKKEKAIV